MVGQWNLKETPKYNSNVLYSSEEHGYVVTQYYAYGIDEYHIHLELPKWNKTIHKELKQGLRFLEKHVKEDYGVTKIYTALTLDQGKEYFRFLEVFGFKPEISGIVNGVAGQRFVKEI